MRIPIVTLPLIAVATFYLVLAGFSGSPPPADEALSLQASPVVKPASPANDGAMRATATLGAMARPAELPDAVRVAVASDFNQEIALPIVQPEPITTAARTKLERDRLVFQLEARVKYLEARLAGVGVWESPATRWLEALGPDEQPEPATVITLSEYLAPYPVELTPQEGRWVLGRILADDWLAWGPTIDEALILYLSPERLIAELPAPAIASLRTEWREEGYFP